MRYALSARPCEDTCATVRESIAPKPSLYDDQEVLDHDRWPPTWRTRTSLNRRCITSVFFTRVPCAVYHRPSDPFVSHSSGHIMPSAIRRPGPWHHIFNDVSAGMQLSSSISPTYQGPMKANIHGPDWQRSDQLQPTAYKYDATFLLSSNLYPNRASARGGWTIYPHRLHPDSPAKLPVSMGLQSQETGDPLIVPLVRSSTNLNRISCQ